MHVVDLSHTIHTGMPVFPSDEAVNVRRTHHVHKDGFAQTGLALTTHAGTHVDVAAHLFADAPGLDWLGPDNFAGWGTVIDCTELPGNRIDQPLLTHLGQYEVLDFILFRTGWDRYWNTDRYFNGFPTLTEMAARYLGGLSLKGVGFDTPSPDPADSRDLPAHHTLLDHGLVIVENLTNLGELPESDFIFSCLPLKILDGEASPVRAVGMTF